jgi:hypothetical protein
MPAPLEELNTRISELKADLNFFALATQLRPRIGDAVQWQAPVAVLQLVRQFMGAKTSRPEGVYGPLLVRLLASFERYVRMLVVQSVEQRVSGFNSFEEIPESLINRNLILTGRILAAVGAPRDHLTLDIERLIANLATCKKGGVFQFNSQAFSATVTAASPAVIDKAFEHLNVTDWWDVVGANVALISLLGKKGARATGERAKERLKELWRWRNQLAHAGDEEIALSESQLNEAIDFIDCFSSALDAAVKKRLKEN